MDWQLDAAELRAMQAPIKERYKGDPGAAMITLKAKGSIDDSNIACKVETGRALAVAGLHPATGGSGLELCSGDMLLEALVEPLESFELLMQVDHAEVVALCSCGCPSIGLRADGPEMPREAIKRLSDLGRDDVLNVTAWGTNRQGRKVEATLHVVFGRLVELEVWAGTCAGEAGTNLPQADTLRRNPRSP